MISVVIPAYNEEKSISSCLTALQLQKTYRSFEVIIVDNASTDQTVRIVNTFAKRLNVRIVSEKQKGRGAARARGFKEARGEMILSTDADSIVSSNWIESIATHLAKNSVAVTGICQIIDCGVLTNTFINFLQPASMQLYRLSKGYYWLNGFNFGIYKKIYEQSGGFNKDLTTQEDVELSMRVAKLGRIQFLSNLRVIVSGRRFKGGVIKGLYPYAKTYVDYFFLKKKHIELSDVR